MCFFWLVLVELVIFGLCKKKKKKDFTKNKRITEYKVGQTWRNLLSFRLSFSSALRKRKRYNKEIREICSYVTIAKYLSGFLSPKSFLCNKILLIFLHNKIFLWASLLPSLNLNWSYILFKRVLPVAFTFWNIVLKSSSCQAAGIQKDWREIFIFSSPFPYLTFFFRKDRSIWSANCWQTWGLFHPTTQNLKMILVWNLCNPIKEQWNKNNPDIQY